MAEQPAVFDTNVIANALIGTSDRAEACLRAIGAASSIAAPDLLLAELANVVWQLARHGVDVDTIALLGDVESLVDEIVPTRALWAEAVAMAVALDHPAYDMLFAALASRRSWPLVTDDAALRRRVGGLAMTPEMFVADVEKASESS